MDTFQQERTVTDRMAVLGGGTMGVGIAYVAAQAGYDVLLVEPDDRRIDTLGAVIRDAVSSAIARGKLNAVQGDALIGRITRVATIEALPEGLDLVVETVPERIDLKLDVLARAAARGPGLLASNTSALSIDRLAEALPEPQQFLGMHFFNPVWSIKLVELVRGDATTEATLDLARSFVTRLGKESLTVRNVPGFATSRLDLIASLEAIRMVESGVASAEDIDRAALLAYRHPVGPLRLSDIVGLDVRLDIARTLEAAHGPRFAPPTLLVRMVAEGKLGAKSGEGFFTWPAAN